MSDTEITAGDQVVGVADRAYEVSGRYVVFDEVLVKGSFGPDFTYRGKPLRLIHVHTMIGLLVDHRGPRGPVAKGVLCEVIEASKAGGNGAKA